MIYDTLDNLNQYTGLFENLDTAINFIENTDLSTLPLGKTQIDGDNVFVSIFDVETKLTEDVNFETHSKYMDLQCDIEGTELCEVALGDIKEIKAYSEESDIAFYESELSCALILNPERFAIFMIEEPHKPTLRTADCERVKKAVFKIAYDSI